MSDIPPPPGATPPPPPPPANLTAPPGYAAYAPSYMSSVALKRVNGLSTWIVVLTAIAAAAGVASTLASRLALGEARDFLADRIDENDFVEAYAPAALFGIVQFVAFVAVIVLTMIWMYRLASNHQALQRNGKWRPGWAIGGWFLPPLALYIIPYLMFRELWKASDPTVPAGDQRWKENGVSPVVTVWWILYGLVAPFLTFAFQDEFGADVVGGSTKTLAEALDEQLTISLVTALVTAAAAAAYIVMVRQLSSRHRQLTGESAQPS